MLDVVLEDRIFEDMVRLIFVSILVVLDVVLEGVFLHFLQFCISRFNPCCAGCSSGRVGFFDALENFSEFQSLLCWM